MQLICLNKYYILFILLFFNILNILHISCSDTDSQTHNDINLKPFLDTVSVFKNDDSLDNADYFDEEFNINSEDKVKLNLNDSKLNVNSQEFRNVTDVYGKDSIELENGHLEEKVVEKLDELDKNVDNSGSDDFSDFFDASQIFILDPGRIESSNGNKVEDSGGQYFLDEPNPVDFVHEEDDRHDHLDEKLEELDHQEPQEEEEQEPEQEEEDEEEEDQEEEEEEEEGEQEHEEQEEEDVYEPEDQKPELEQPQEERKYQEHYFYEQVVEETQTYEETYEDQKFDEKIVEEEPEEEEVEEDVGSRRFLKLNTEPEDSEESDYSQTSDSEIDMFKAKMLYLVNAINKLKTEVIQKNNEIDEIFYEIAQMKMEVKNSNNIAYHSLLKELEQASKDLNLLRKGSIYTAYSDNLLGNITVMEAIHGLFVIYRTPFILLRHNFRWYARFEGFVYTLFKYKLPNLSKSLLHSTFKYIKNIMVYGYGNTLKFTRTTHIYHTLTKKTHKIYDSLLTDFIKDTFEVDLTHSKKNKRVVSIWERLASKLNLPKHCAYIKHSLLFNAKISSSFLSKNDPQDEQTNTDFLYIKQKDHRMLEVLYHIYRLNLVGFVQAIVLQVLRYIALFFNVFVKDSKDTINGYTKPFIYLREDSLFKFKNIHFLLKSSSIYALQKVDLFMDYCFNYANKLNPELSILVPKDLSNRIFFVSVVILVTIVLIFMLQALFHCLLCIVNTALLGPSNSVIRSRFRHWYHRSCLRHFVHIFKRTFSSHGRSHKRKHRSHRNNEGTHRMVNEGTVAEADDYMEFKSTFETS